MGNISEILKQEAIEYVNGSFFDSLLDRPFDKFEASSKPGSTLRGCMRGFFFIALITFCFCIYLIYQLHDTSQIQGSVHVLNLAVCIYLFLIVLCEITPSERQENTKQ